MGLPECVQKPQKISSEPTTDTLYAREAGRFDAMGSAEIVFG